MHNHVIITHLVLLSSHYWLMPQSSNTRIANKADSNSEQETDLFLPASWLFLPAPRSYPCL